MIPTYYVNYSEKEYRVQDKKYLLKDIDVRMDYVKDEVIRRLSTKKGFRVQDIAKDAY